MAKAGRWEPSALEPPGCSTIREAVRELCDRFPAEYWRGLEPDSYPSEFVSALNDHGWLAALIPEQYGGSGLGIAEASVILEEINASGGTPRPVTPRCTRWARCCGTARISSEPSISPSWSSGELRLQAFARHRAHRRVGHHQDPDHRADRTATGSCCVGRRSSPPARSIRT